MLILKHFQCIFTWVNYILQYLISTPTPAKPLLISEILHEVKLDKMLTNSTIWVNLIIPDTKTKIFFSYFLAKKMCVLMRKESLDNLTLIWQIEGKRDRENQWATSLISLCGWMAEQGGEPWQRKKKCSGSQGIGRCGKSWSHVLKGPGTWNKFGSYLFSK